MSFVPSPQGRWKRSGRYLELCVFWSQIDPKNNSDNFWSDCLLGAKNRPTILFYFCLVSTWVGLQYLKFHMKTCGFEWKPLYSNLMGKSHFLSWPSSGPEICVIWVWKMPAWGWGSLWESSSFVPWLALNAFRDVSGAVPECPWISGLMRKSSSRASAPSMRFSVLLNSCDNFFVTLPSISSETWAM